MIKNTASQYVSAQLVAVADGEDITSGATTVYVTGDAGTQASGSGTVTHEGNGCWSYAPTQAETNYDHVAYTFVNSLAVSVTVQRDPVTASDYKADVSSLATAANLSTVDTVVDAIKVVTDQFVFTVANQVDCNAPTAASVRSEIDSNSTQLAAIVADTNELQGDDVPGLIAALNNFNPASDTVANVTLVDTTTTNTDMRGTDSAATAAALANVPADVWSAAGRSLSDPAGLPDLPQLARWTRME